MADSQDSPIPTEMNPPEGQAIWECPFCSRRYLTEQPPRVVSPIPQV